MAANLDKLMGLKGVIAAGEFGVDGKLIAHKGNLTQEHAEMTAMMCAANNLNLKMQAESFSKYSGMEWRPLNGWAVSAGKYSVCVMGRRGVFVESDKADFNELFREIPLA